jgi:hypothetical protein
VAIAFVDPVAALGIRPPFEIAESVADIFGALDEALGQPAIVKGEDVVGVIERWRLTGNTVLIAGTDLAERTIDADDIFTFLDGRLAERFIQRPEDVSNRLGNFEWRPDAEGRYRVNECYCHDTTWQQALAELLKVSDGVLMDLRNFVATNQGCLYELQALAATPGLHRVVVLINERTELAAAQAATAAAPAGRFVWLAQQGSQPLATDAVLAALLAAG